MASFSEFFDNVGQWFNGVGQGIKDWFNDTTTNVVNWFNKEVAPAVKPIAQGISNKVADFLPEPDEKTKRKLYDSGATNLPDSWQYEDFSVASSAASSNDSSSVASSSTSSNELKESFSSDQKELWEREDAIRKHVEEREDSAYQRAVADMKKAGINPELLGVNPANSGGGIIQASRMDTSLLNTDLSGAYSELIAQLNNEVKVDEKQKDRILSIVNNFVDVAGKLLLFKFLKK